jgi:hypothetical protein
MRTRPLPAHSGAETDAGSTDAAQNAPRTDGVRPTAVRRDVDRAQLEQDWSRRRRVPAASAAAVVDLPGDAAADDLVRSRLAAERAAALRPTADRPAPRR